MTKNKTLTCETLRHPPASQMLPLPVSILDLFHQEPLPRHRGYTMSRGAL